MVIRISDEPGVSQPTKARGGGTKNLKSVAPSKAYGGRNRVNSPKQLLPAPQQGSAPSLLPAPQQAPQQAPTGGGGSYGGGSDVGSFGVGSPGAPAPEPMAPPQLSEEDWLKGDSAFGGQVAAIQRALRDYMTEADEQSKLYDVDFNKGLESLGFRNNSWDAEDRMGAYGRGRSALMNDFASRGLLNSTDFNNSLGDFEASMQNQLGSMQEARTNFLGETGRERSRRQNEAKDAESAARMEALARRASSYGL